MLQYDKMNFYKKLIEFNLLNFYNLSYPEYKYLFSLG